LLVVSEQGQTPTNRIEDFGLPSLMTDGPEQVEGPAGVGEGLGIATLPLDGVAEGVVGIGLPSLVAALAVQVEGLPEVGVGVIEAIQTRVGSN
jgi:hypothetical protein